MALTTQQEEKLALIIKHIVAAVDVCLCKRLAAAVTADEASA